MRIIAIAGEPATGKTTLMRRVLARLKESRKRHFFTYGLVRGQVFGGPTHPKVYVPGLYRANTIFAGTDALSMAVQPDVEKFIDFVRKTETETVRHAFLWEGDRLSSRSLFSKIPPSELELYILKADEKRLESRHLSRKDTQTETFKRSRKTKVENLARDFRSTFVSNNTSVELEQAVNLIWERICK